MSCPSCFAGHEHHGDPTGVVETVHGLPTYVARPPDGSPPRAVLIFIPDAFGWEFVNCRLLADEFARDGRYLVYLPELMAGRSAPTWLIPIFTEFRSAPGFTGFLWKIGAFFQILYGIGPFLLANRPAKSWPRVRAFCGSARSAPETQSLALFAVGYCWGGKHCFTLAAENPPLATAVFTAHPSMLSIPADPAAVSAPISVAWGSKDTALSAEKYEEMKRVLEAKADVLSEVVMLEGADHGFGVRADLGNSQGEKLYADARAQALSWFERFVPGGAAQEGR